MHTNLEYENKKLKQCLKDRYLHSFSCFQSTKKSRRESNQHGEKSRMRKRIYEYKCTSTNALTKVNSDESRLLNEHVEISKFINTS